MESVHGKFEMEKFDGSGDFGMGKFKMQMQLELQGLGYILTVAASSTKVETMDDSDDVTDKEDKIDPLAKRKGYSSEKPYLLKPHQHGTKESNEGSHRHGGLESA